MTTDDNGARQPSPTDAEMLERRTPGSSRVARGKKPRALELGDTAPTLTEEGIATDRIDTSTSSALEEKSAAILDMLSGTAPEDAVPHPAFDVLDASTERLDKLARRAADEELAEDWREGGYPYRQPAVAATTSGRSTACRSSC
jgi:hypothetical protein